MISVRRFSAGIALVLLAALAAGCTHSSSPQSHFARDSNFAQVSSETLFADVSRLMNRLDEVTIVDLRPPEIVLDASTSRNRKEVLATLTANPQDPARRVDLLTIVTNNGQFDRLKIVPGDQVRMFIELETDEFGQRNEFGNRTAVNLVVREVLNANQLLIVESPFQEPVRSPVRVEIWRYSNERLRDMSDRFQKFFRAGKSIAGYELPRGKQLPEHEAVSCWEPTPEDHALRSVVDRLNQWARGTDAKVDWQPSALIETLPERAQKVLNPSALDSMTFTLLDARYIQESVWARDIARWAATDTRFMKPPTGLPDGLDKQTLNELQTAAALFDWTVRHIQLADTERRVIPHQPWHTLLYGVGTAEERAAVFALLARQQGLHVVQLGLGDKETAEPKFWLSALQSGGQLYLFDPRLGLPVRGAAGKGIATLAEAQREPRVLEQLSLPERPYGTSSDDVQQIVALVDESPLGLTRRGQLLEEHLAGRDRFMLTNFRAADLNTLKSLPGVADVRLWDLPYRVLDAQLSLDRRGRQQAQLEFFAFAFNPWLYKARVLHFQGKFDFEKIKQLYDERTAERYNNRTARYFYRNARVGDSVINDPRRAQQERDIILIAKLNASYWLGLLAMDDGDDDVAIDFFAERTLAVTPDGPWTFGARYNLGRMYELEGDFQRASEQYEKATDSPQHPGNLLRAAWLTAAPPNEEQEKAAEPEASPPADDSKAEDSASPPAKPQAEDSSAEKPEPPAAAPPADDSNIEDGKTPAAALPATEGAA